MITPAAPTVSVLIPCFNREAFVGATIRSVLGQTFDDWELIVIDDGSIDQSARVIERALEECGDHSKTRWIRRENRGIARTAGEGLELARGRWFALLDSDDLWYPDKLARQVEALSSSKAGAIFSDCDVIDADGRTVDRMGRIRPYRGGDIYRDIVFQRFMPPSPTWMVEREAFNAAGGFHPTRIVLDFDAWVRFSRGHEVAFIDEPLAAYRVHEGNRSRLLVEQNFVSMLESLEDAMDRDAALAADRRKIIGRVRAGFAGAFFNETDLARARREALRSIAEWPFDPLPWRIAAGSLAGRGVVERIRQVRRGNRTR